MLSMAANLILNSFITPYEAVVVTVMTGANSRDHQQQRKDDRNGTYAMPFMNTYNPMNRRRCSINITSEFFAFFPTNNFHIFTIS